MPTSPTQFTCASSDVPSGRYVEVKVGDRSILLCRVAGALSAIENRCSHMGRPLAGGRLIGARIICPQHSAAFDVTTGRALSFPAVEAIRTFAVVESEGLITLSVET